MMFVPIFRTVRSPLADDVAPPIACRTMEKTSQEMKIQV